MSLPIYKAVIETQDDGIYAVSLVTEPAVEKDFLHFKKDEKPQKAEFKFEVEDEVQHMISGVLMLANTPIYRYSPEMGEYYILFDKECIKQMVERMLQRGTFGAIDLQHDEYYLWDKCRLVEAYIKDSAKGINPTAFADVPDGSLFVTYKVDSVEIWDKIVSGELRGFSLEGWFGLNLVQMSKQTEEQEILQLIEQIKNKIKK